MDIVALDAMVSYQLPDTESYVPSDVGLVVEFNAVYIPPDPPEPPEPIEPVVTIPDGLIWETLLSVGFISPGTTNSIGYANGAFWNISPAATSTANRLVFRSETGESWSELTGFAGYGNKIGGTFPFMFFDNKLWVIGGNYGSGFGQFTDEVYSSVDGYTWIFVANLPGNRTNHSGCVFNNKMWISGGIFSATTMDSKVYSSSDGITWTLETSTPGWHAREFHAMIAFNNKLWVMGGYYNGSSIYNDIWSSVDGVTWVQEVAVAPWSTRYGLGVCEFDGKLWLYGGWNGSAHKDLWNSTDGINWTLVGSDVGLPAVQSAALISANSTMYAFGGGSVTNGYKAI